MLTIPSAPCTSRPARERSGNVRVTTSGTCAPSGGMPAVGLSPDGSSAPTGRGGGAVGQNPPPPARGGPGAGGGARAPPRPGRGAFFSPPPPGPGGGGGGGG